MSDAYLANFFLKKLIKKILSKCSNMVLGITCVLFKIDYSFAVYSLYFCASKSPQIFSVLI